MKTDLDARIAVVQDQIRRTESSICRQALRERLAKMMKERDDAEPTR